MNGRNARAAVSTRRRIASPAVGLTGRAGAARAAGIALGVLADAVFADPRRGHPVAGFGRAALRLERAMWADSVARGAAYAADLHGVRAGPGRRGGPRESRAPGAGRRRDGAGDLGRPRAGRRSPARARRWRGLLDGGRHGRGARAARAPLRARPRRPRGRRARPGHGGVRGGEHVRRGRRPAAVGGARRRPGSAGLPRGEHPGRDGRLPQPPLRPVRPGGGAGRRRGEPRARAGHRAADCRARPGGRRHAAPPRRGSWPATGAATRARTPAGARRPLRGRSASGSAGPTPTPGARRPGPCSAPGAVRRRSPTSRGPCACRGCVGRRPQCSPSVPPGCRR